MASYNSQTPPYDREIRFKDTRTNHPPLSDLMVDGKDQRVVVEIKLVHGSKRPNRQDLEADRMKLAATDSQRGIEIFPLFVVASFWHPANPDKSHRRTSPWFSKWIASESTSSGLSMKASALPLEGGGEFTAQGWIIQPQQLVGQLAAPTGSA